MPSEPIRSVSNPHIAHIRELCAKRKARKAHGEFFVEGVQALVEAQTHGWEIRQLLYSPTATHTETAQTLLAEIPAKAHLSVSDYILEKLSDRDNPAELMGIVAQPPDDLGRIPVGDRLLVVLADRPRNAGNLGTLIRSADALGADGFLVLEPAVDIYDPKTIRATMGSLFGLPVVRVETADALRQWLEDSRKRLPRLQVISTTLTAALQVDEADWTLPSVLVVGNEQTGVGAAVRVLCDAEVSIPMAGVAESLNFAVAGSIALYEAMRQRMEG